MKLTTAVIAQCTQTIVCVLCAVTVLFMFMCKCMMKFALITSSHGKHAMKMAEKKGSVFDYYKGKKCQDNAQVAAKCQFCTASIKGK